MEVVGQLVGLDPDQRPPRLVRGAEALLRSDACELRREALGCDRRERPPERQPARDDVLPQPAL
jgi:hypothetical protein